MEGHRMNDAYQVFPHPSLDWRLTNTRMQPRHFSTREEGISAGKSLFSTCGWLPDCTHGLKKRL